MRNCLLFLTLFLAACAPQSTSQPSFDSLTPYLTGTPSPTQLEGLTPAETPLPSPTPFLYKVTGNDTMSQIAEKYNISLDALRAANPDVDPNAMSIGIELTIPNNSNLTGASTPTPVPVSVKQIECHPTADQAMWCFVLVEAPRNDFSDSMENVSAQVTLVDSNGQVFASQAALSMLDILPPNTSLPLVTFFAPSIPADVKPQVQILTAIRLLPNDVRYLPAIIQNTLVQIDSSGRTAQVNGQVYLPSESKPASQVWVAAVAYDHAGRAVGVRRWESNAALEAGNNLPFEFMISSIAGEIDRVEFAVEARP